MSGHNKWSTIKHKKAKADKQKGKIFSKLVKEIMMAAKLGDPDPDMNPRLRLAIQKAKEANMPNDNINRAIQKGSSNADESNLDEITFEIYAPFGVAIIAEALTDNRNRTIPNIKSILNKADATLATRGAVSYQFDKKGLIVFEPGSDEDTVMEIATENDAEDMLTNDDGSIEVTTEPKNFEQVKKAFDEKEIAYVSAEITMIPQNTISLDDAQ
ncbi:YebC/PmpR family DNA-binding transcriptional regulator, partial [Candidatus Margulisiibacteriota bacterium]